MPGALEEIQELFGERSLYQILSVTKKATKNEIRKAYYQLSLKVHPDRVPADQLEKATREFQALGKIYEVLTDDDKRAIYDEEGTIDDESFVAQSDRDWNEYWRLLFPKVKITDIKKFEQQYKGSAEELEDLKSAYNNTKGDMDGIIDSVLCATIDDEPRFREILENLIKEGELVAYPAFTNERQCKRDARKRKAEAEKKDAEKAQKKLAKEENLTALIQKNQKSRGEQSDAFFAYMEDKYGATGDGDDSSDEDSATPPKKRKTTGQAKKEPTPKKATASKKKVKSTARKSKRKSK